jgi:hypothetical protein
MALHICKCSYSTINKSNYNKHIKICKQCIEPITDSIYKENQSKFDTQLAVIKQQYERQLEEQVAVIRKEYEEKLKQQIDMITKEYEKKKKKYKCKREVNDDDETKRIKIKKELRKRKIEYDENDSLSTLRKIHKSSYQKTIQDTVQSSS